MLYALIPVSRGSLHVGSPYTEKENFHYTHLTRPTLTPMHNMQKQNAIRINYCARLPLLFYILFAIFFLAEIHVCSAPPCCCACLCVCVRVCVCVCVCACVCVCVCVCVTYPSARRGVYILLPVCVLHMLKCVCVCVCVWPCGQLNPKP
jgi:hypothetical protein